MIHRRTLLAMLMLSACEVVDDAEIDGAVGEDGSLAAIARNVHFEGGFESGEFLPNGGQLDSFFIRTLPNPQIGSEVISTGAGGGDPSAKWDSKVVRSESVGGQTVRPRRGRREAITGRRPALPEQHSQPAPVTPAARAARAR